MKASVRLGRIWNIPIGLSTSWFFIFALVTWSLATGVFPATIPGLDAGVYWLLGLVTSVLFFSSVLAHELGHAFFALRNSVPVRAITLFFFGGVAEITREPKNAGAEFRIAIAGPLVSLMLAALFGGLTVLGQGLPIVEGPALWLARINLMLALFNMIPGFPRKGDKVGLMTFADDVMQFVSPRQGRGQFYRMLELLYAVQAQPVEPDYQRALSYLAVKQRKRALVVIFTDLSGGLSTQTLVGQVSMLARHSLPLVVTISDPDVHAAAQQRPHTMLTVYQRAAAQQLLDERQLALDSLRRQGVLTLDVPANQLSMAVINRYLELKGRMLL